LLQKLHIYAIYVSQDPIVKIRRTRLFSNHSRRKSLIFNGPAKG
jgi:hypothetical protein